MKKASTDTRAGVSGVSVLMVFLTLCIAIFAVLTLSSAQSAWQLMQKNQQQIANYQTCDNMAQQHIAQINSLLSQGGAPALAGTNYKVEGNVVSFETAEIGQRKMLVKLRLEDNQTKVIEYRLINTEESNYDNGTLNVLQ